MLRRVLPWIRALLLRRRLEREMLEEYANHLERSTERLIARGMSPEEARREAAREFGNVTYLQEEGRYARGTVWLDALAADCRFAFRHFVRRRGTTFTMLAVLTVGLCISTLTFSYVHAYAVQPPLGIAQSADLVRIRGSQSAGPYGRAVRPFAEEEFRAYRQMRGPFAQVAGWTDAMVTLDAGDDPDRRALEARATFVTENYFPLLGVRPMLGPGLPSVESGGPAVAVIGHAAWDQLFGRAPGIIGSTLAVNGVTATIVGVAPEQFSGVGGPTTFQLWLPLDTRIQVMSGSPGAFRAVARLRPGVTAREATAAVQVLARRHQQDDARELQFSADVVPLLSANGDPMFDRDVRLMTIVLGLLALLVLLVTCTSVSALLTGLAMARRQEIAIRLSMGAPRTRLIRQLLTESALLGVIAGAAALGLAWLVLRVVQARAGVLPFELGVTWSSTLFTFGVALAVGVVFGLSPALHATRAALAGALKDSTAGVAGARPRLQRGLVVAQIAFTQPLVVLLAAVLLVILGEYSGRLRTAGAEHIVSLTLLGLDRSTPQDGLEATMNRVVDRLQATPGVQTAVVDWGSAFPLGSYAVEAEDRVVGAAQQSVRLEAERAAAGSFGVMGLPLVRGRDFARGETAVIEGQRGEIGVVVGADLARRLWAGADPIGRRLRAASDTVRDARGLVVVGLVDEPARAKRAGESYRIFLPPDTGRVPTRILLRTAGVADALVPALRAVVQQATPGTVFRMRTLAQIEEVRREHFRMATGGVSAAGLMALLLSAIGLYAIVAFAVGQRMREIAVRIAVGANTRQIVRRFVADGLRLSALGLALGLPVSLIGLRALLTLDDDLPAVHLAPVTAIAALGVVLVATLAAWLPARRAAAVDPATILRGG